MRWFKKKPAEISLPEGQFYPQDDTLVDFLSKPGQLKAKKKISKKFSLVILNKNAPEFIIPLVEKLLSLPEIKDNEIIIGDTGSRDKETLAFYEKVKEKVVLVRDLKYHFSTNYNHLIKNYARGQYLGIMNNDIVLPDGKFLRSAERYLGQNPEVGIVGFKLLYPDRKLQHGGVYFFEKGEHAGLPYHRYHGKREKYLKGLKDHVIPAVTGAFLFCRRTDFLRLGGFDETYAEEAQDIDLCLKFKRVGLKAYFLPLPDIVHVENGTRTKGSENLHDRSYFLYKWLSFLQASVLGSKLNSF